MPEGEYALGESVEKKSDANAMFAGGCVGRAEVVAEAEAVGESVGEWVGVPRMAGASMVKEMLTVMPLGRGAMGPDANRSRTKGACVQMGVASKRVSGACNSVPWSS